MGPCQWTPHEDEPSEPAPPTLPCPQGAAPVCADRVADPISAPNHLDSLPHPRQPRHPQSPPPPHSTALSASEPLCATPRTEAKPIKDRPSSCGLAHCTVCSVFAAMKIILLIGYSAPRNRANLFHSQLFSPSPPRPFIHLPPILASRRLSTSYPPVSWHPKNKPRPTASTLKTPPARAPLKANPPPA